MTTIILLVEARLGKVNTVALAIVIQALIDKFAAIDGHVERAQRTHTEEFHEVTDTSFEIAELNQALLEWERIYNTVRPHQALGYLTPQEFLKLYQQNKRKEGGVTNHMNEYTVLTRAQASCTMSTRSICPKTTESVHRMVVYGESCNTSIRRGRNTREKRYFVSEGVMLPIMPSIRPPLAPALLEAEPEPLQIDLQRTALIVIDAQNCFITKGGMCDLWGRDIQSRRRGIEPIRRLTEAARANGIKVIYIVHVYSSDLHDSGGPESPNWYKDLSLISHREHPEWGDKFYIHGTWGAEIVEELTPKEGDIIVEKPRYSAFFGTNLDVILKTYQVKYLLFTGFTTNCCVEASIREAYNYDYFPILVTDAAMSQGPKFTQEATAYIIRTVYGWVTTTGNILKAIKLLQRTGGVHKNMVKEV